MARTPEGPEARYAQVAIRFTPEERKQFDLQRGNRTRAQYVRELIARDGQKERNG